MHNNTVMTIPIMIFNVLRIAQYDSYAENSIKTEERMNKK